MFLPALHVAVFLFSTLVTVGSGLDSGDEVSSDLCELPDGVFPDPDTCKAFIRCQSGVPEVEFCSDGLLFNPLKVTCDFSKTGNCSDVNDFDESARIETNDVACSEDGPNIYPIQSSCTEYYICENNTAFKVKCPGGLLMNAEKLICDYSDNVDCDVISSTEESTVEIKAIYGNDEEESEIKTSTISNTHKSSTQSAGTTIQIDAETDFDSKVTNEDDLSSNFSQDLRETASTQTNSDQSTAVTSTSTNTAEDQLISLSPGSDKEGKSLDISVTENLMNSSDSKTSSDKVETDLSLNTLEDNYETSGSLEPNLSKSDVDVTTIAIPDEDTTGIDSGSDVAIIDIFMTTRSNASEQFTPVKASTDSSNDKSTSSSALTNENSIFTKSSVNDETAHSDDSSVTLDSEIATDHISTDVTKSKMSLPASYDSTSQNSLIEDSILTGNLTSTIETTDGKISNLEVNTTDSTMLTSLKLTDTENAKDFEITTSYTTVMERDSKITPGRTLSTPQALMSSDPLTDNETTKYTTSTYTETKITPKYLIDESTSTVDNQSIDAETTQINKSISRMDEITEEYEASSTKLFDKSNSTPTSFGFPSETSTSEIEISSPGESTLESLSSEISREEVSVINVSSEDKFDKQSSLSNDIETSTTSQQPDSVSMSNFTTAATTETVMISKYASSENTAENDISVTQNFTSSENVSTVPTENGTSKMVNTENSTSTLHSSTELNETSDYYFSSSTITNKVFDKNETSMETFEEDNFTTPSRTSVYSDEYSTASETEMNKTFQVSEDSIAETQTQVLTSSLSDLTTNNPNAESLMTSKKSTITSKSTLKNVYDFTETLGTENPIDTKTSDSEKSSTDNIVLLTASTSDLKNLTDNSDSTNYTPKSTSEDEIPSQSETLSTYKDNYPNDLVTVTSMHNVTEVVITDIRELLSTSEHYFDSESTYSDIGIDSKLSTVEKFDGSQGTSDNTKLDSELSTTEEFAGSEGTSDNAEIDSKLSTAEVFYGSRSTTASTKIVSTLSTTEAFDSESTSGDNEITSELSTAEEFDSSRSTTGNTEIYSRLSTTKDFDGSRSTTADTEIDSKLSTAEAFYDTESTSGGTEIDSNLSTAEGFDDSRSTTVGTDIHSKLSSLTNFNFMTSKKPEVTSKSTLKNLYDFTETIGTKNLITEKTSDSAKNSTDNIVLLTASTNDLENLTDNSASTSYIPKSTSEDEIASQRETITSTYKDKYPNDLITGISLDNVTEIVITDINELPSTSEHYFDSESTSSDTEIDSKLTSNDFDGSPDTTANTKIDSELSTTEKFDGSQSTSDDTERGSKLSTARDFDGSESTSGDTEINSKLSTTEKFDSRSTITDSEIASMQSTIEVFDSESTSAKTEIHLKVSTTDDFDGLQSTTADTEIDSKKSTAEKLDGLESTSGDTEIDSKLSTAEGFDSRSSSGDTEIDSKLSTTEKFDSRSTIVDSEFVLVQSTTEEFDSESTSGDTEIHSKLSTTEDFDGLQSTTADTEIDSKLSTAEVFDGSESSSGDAEIDSKLSTAEGFDSRSTIVSTDTYSKVSSLTDFSSIKTESITSGSTREFKSTVSKVELEMKSSTSSQSLDLTNSENTIQTASSNIAVGSKDEISDYNDSTINFISNTGPSSTSESKSFTNVHEGKSTSEVSHIYEDETTKISSIQQITDETLNPFWPEIENFTFVDNRTLILTTKTTDLNSITTTPSTISRKMTVSNIQTETSDSLTSEEMTSDFTDTQSTLKTSVSTIGTKTPKYDETLTPENELFPSTGSLVTLIDPLNKSTSSNSEITSEVSSDGITDVFNDTADDSSLNSLSSNEIDSSTTNVFYPSSSESTHAITDFRRFSTATEIDFSGDDNTESSNWVKTFEPTSAFTSKISTEYTSLPEISKTVVTEVEDFQTTNDENIVYSTDNKTDITKTMNTDSITVTRGTLPEHTKEKKEYQSTTTQSSIAETTTIKTTESSKDLSESTSQTISTTEFTIILFNDTTESTESNTDYSTVSIASRNLSGKTDDDSDNPSISYSPSSLRTETSLSSTVPESEHRGISLTDDSVDVTTLNPVCVTSEGNFPYPENCNMFYRCTKGVPVLSSCVGDEHFDPVKRICTNPCLAKCDPKADCGTTESITSVSESTSQSTLSTALVSSSDTPFTETEEKPYITTTEYITEETTPNDISSSTSEKISTTTEDLVSYSPTLETTAGKNWTDSLTSFDWSSSVADTNATKDYTETISNDYTNITSERTTAVIDSNNTNSNVQITSTTEAYDITAEIQTEITRKMISSTVEKSTKTEYSTPSEISESTVEIDSTSDSSGDGEDASSTSETSTTSTTCNDESCFSKLPTSATHVPLRLCSRNDFLSEPNCNEYLDCTRDVPIKLECPRGLHFNPTTRVCDWPYKAECGTLPKPLFEPTNLFSCPCKSCLIPSTTSCSQYYLCLGFTAYKMNCSYNLNFDRSRNTCNYEPLVDCNHLISSSTTEIEPTESSTKTSTTELLISTAKTSTTTASFVCPSREGLFRYPGNCEMFYQCSNWYPYTMHCPATTHFSETTNRCEFPCDAKCDSNLNCGGSTSAPSDPRCSCLNCRLPSSESCTKYIVCASGKARIEYCPWGQTFDEKRATCDWAHKVACHHSAICPDRNGKFPHKDDCRKFVHCSNGIPYVKSCPNPLEYDPVKKRCEWPSGRCNYLPAMGKELEIFKAEGKRKGWRCPKTFGYFSDDTLCKKFYFCSLGTPTLKECSPGLLYNVRYQTCDWEKKVRCNSNRNQKTRRCRKFDHHAVCLDDRKPLPHVLCNMYYDCTAGRACAKQCPIGLYFNNMTGLCDLPENVKCFNNPGEDEYSLKELSLKCASGFEGREVNPANDACFYYCKQGKVVSGCCSKGQIYNFHKNKCERRTKYFRI